MARKAAGVPQPKKGPVLTMPVGPARTTSVAEQTRTLDDQGKAPQTRMRDARAAHQLFLTLMEADKKSSYNRAILQEMLDGSPPHKESALVQAGMGWVYNLNFLDADTRMQAALVSYDDLADSSEHLIVPEAEPNALPPEDLQESLDVISEEWSKTVREESDFYLSWTGLATEFVGHGVGFAYFPDCETPWWQPGGWDQCLIPRKTPLKDEAISLFITRQSYRVDQLWAKIKDASTATGWNIPEVKRAIVSASKHKRNIKRWYDHWPEVEMELKNNDLGFGLGDCEEVECVQYWQREFDGSYSFYIGLEDGTNQDYLYKDEHRYENVNQAFVSFTLSAGTTGNRTFHSIRGMLWKMFPGVQVKNRFSNKILTNTDISMTLLVQGDDGDTYDDMQITLGPAIGYLPAGAKVVDRQLPDVGTQGMPVVEFLDRQVQSATGQFQSPTASVPEPTQKGNPATRYQIQSYQQEKGSLTSNSVNRFYRSMDRLMRESFRRAQVIGPSGRPLSGGKCAYPEIKDFYMRCAERGVTAEFIQKKIRRVTAARAIGNGSPQMRMLALQELSEMAGALDETGRALVIRDRIAMRFGRATADRYAPKVTRIAPDAQIATIENAALAAADIPVLPDQNHAVHDSIHVPAFQQIIQQIVQYREQDPEADFSPMKPVVDTAVRMHQHAAQHLQGMAANPLNVKVMKSYKAALEQGGNLLAGFARELQAQERHQDQPGATPSSEQDRQDAISASDPKLTLEIQRQQAQLQHEQVLHQLEQQLASTKVAAAQQKMRLDQITADTQVAAQIDKNRAIS